MDERAAALDAAHRAATDFFAGLDERPAWPRSSLDQMAATFDATLPEQGEDAADLIAELARQADPGLAAGAGGRYFGFVTGAALPAALAADWLVSAWDQNSGAGGPAPATVALERIAGRWICELLGLPAGAAVGFVTGAQTSNVVCLAAAQHAVMRRAGWDLTARGLRGAPPLRLVVGAHRHGAIDRAARMCGIGTTDFVVVPADAQGRMIPAALEAALGADGSSTIVCLQAGEVHTGDFDRFDELIPIAHAHDAWAHVDGAFGLWANAAPSLRHLTAGVAEADSWTTDAHKTLNVPYDCGMAIVRDPADGAAMFRPGGDYLIRGGQDPWDATPELSRRARGVPVWAALRSLGRSGVSMLVERLHGDARRLEAGLMRIPGITIVNAVPYTQVMFRLDDDAATRALGAAILADGTAALTGALWDGRAVLRCSMSSWATTDADIDRTLEAIARIAGAITATPVADVTRGA